MKNQILEKTCFITLKVQPSAGKVTFCRTKKVASAVYVHTYCQLFTSKLCGRIFDNLQIVILQVANLKTANILYNYTVVKVSKAFTYSNTNVSRVGLELATLGLLKKPLDLLLREVRFYYSKSGSGICRYTVYIY